MKKILKPLKIKRKTTNEVRFHPKMGALSTKVTKIQRTLYGIPFETLHKYRETYSGKMKDVEDCKVSELR
ncbi:Uncharacterised protein [Candidatus Ornithobacterium hominis]|uniref:Uncharacterized protein n=1 Tax=Candidatus Ornithobacterium hominis TaxID=2497989 RepID=A0A383U3K2_9FLAO|nr:hypothetical protein [Candidatus Ornithobacterium hominis]MCT7905098.1 hypothetical protein [Candidatus Ornithobacterium hominis]CAI9429899.1 Integrase [Candidatus Ornithobacterium hominis]SZD73523.1 Uncharacterised protein [Candidatus Ornithobacterium hominis]SZD73571.1 Uncharacterised protein [Candidatus Ornithobacterium hominis]